MTHPRTCTRRWSALLIALSCFAAVSGQSADAATATTELQKAIRAATFEVVMRKPEQDLLSYEKPLPLELLPFAERNDKWLSIGTAFAIGPNTFVSAGHVMASGVGSQFGMPSLRDAEGKVYPVDRVLKFSLHEDFMVFSVAKPPSVQPLEIATTSAINDTVFAAGNALGDGVVIRDGLLTSMTPEDQDGRWKWLRFSAAASPGNSGGPLLDTKGRVIGIVIARSPGENLNFALPIERVTADTGQVATFDVRTSFQLPILQKALVTHYRDTFDLPLSYADFSRLCLTSRLTHYKKERDRLLADQADELFPRGASAKLLAMDERPEAPALVTQTDDHFWEANTGDEGDATELPGEGRVALHFVNGTALFTLRRPDGASDDAFYSDSRAAMDMLLKSLKVNRPVGPQSIRVTSAGAAQRDEPFVDRFGRRWQSRSWAVSFMDFEVLSLWLPAPDGYVGMLQFVPSPNRELAAAELQLLANYFQTPYRGTLRQWNAFLERRALRPSVFDQIKIGHDTTKGMRYESPRLRLHLPTDMLRIDDESSLNIDMVYLMDGDTLAWDVGGLTLSTDSEGDSYVAAYRQPRPAKAAGKDLLQRWDHMTNHSQDFDGTLGRDADLKVFWVRASAGRAPAATGSADLPTAVLYELVYRTNETILPRDLELRRRQLVDGIEILER
jgi:NAD(P)-dependent dehydrogenase (short-subunit alcohol dehydrogenase family)